MTPIDRINFNNQVLELIAKLEEDLDQAEKDQDAEEYKKILDKYEAIYLILKENKSLLQNRRTRL